MGNVIVTRHPERGAYQKCVHKPVEMLNLAARLGPRGIHPATQMKLVLPWEHVCSWKELWNCGGDTTTGVSIPAGMDLVPPLSGGQVSQVHPCGVHDPEVVEVAGYPSEGGFDGFGFDQEAPSVMEDRSTWGLPPK